jgi:hypothetical protein
MIYINAYTKKKKKRKGSIIICLGSIHIYASKKEVEERRECKSLNTRGRLHSIFILEKGKNKSKIDPKLDGKKKEERKKRFITYDKIVFVCVRRNELR